MKALSLGRSFFSAWLVLILCMGVTACVDDDEQRICAEKGPLSSIEQNGRWLMINDEYQYIVGIDFQRVASWTDVDYIAALDTLEEYDVNYIRIWIEGVYMDPDDSYHIHPYEYSDGRFDLDSWNNVYWSRLRDIIEAARARQIIVCVSVFNVLLARFDDYQTPFDSDDNINGLFSPRADGDLVPEWYDLDFREDGVRLRDVQQNLLDKTLDEVGDSPNVIVEIMNENGLNTTDEAQAARWQNHWAEYARDNSERLIQVHAHHRTGPQNDAIERYLGEPYIDILNFHFYSGDPNVISRLLHDAQGSGQVLFDNEGSSPRLADASLDYNVLNKAMRNNWGMFTSGGYGALFTLSRHDDKIGDSVWREIGQRLQAQRNIVETLRFWEMSPVDSRNREYDSLVSNGPGSSWQVIANPGSEFFVFFWGTERTNNTRIDLDSGEYEYRYYDVRNGALVGNGDVSGGGVRTIAAPSRDDWNGNAGLALVVQTAPPEPPDPTDPDPEPEPTPEPSLDDLIIETEDYDDEYRMQFEMSHTVVHAEVDGAWARYDDVDFSAGYTAFTARVGVEHENRSIEVRLDSPTGTLLGTLDMALTGGVRTYIEQSTTIEGASGPHDLYLVFTGGAHPCWIDRVRFSGADAEPDPEPEPEPEPTPEPDGGELVIETENYDDEYRMQFEMSHTVVHAEVDGAWARYDDVDFSAGYTIFTARVGVENENRSIEVRLDSPSGTLLGTLDMALTGGVRTYVEQSTSIGGASGMHDLYLVFTGGVHPCWIDRVRFE